MKTKLFIFVVVILTFFLTICTFVQIIARHQRRDPTRVDLLIHKQAEDYLSYLSLITRGQAGLLFRDPFIIGDHSSKPVLVLYPIMGILSIPTHLSPPLVYHIGRVLMIVFLVWATYVLSLAILKNRVWAFIATIISLIAPIPPNTLYRQDVILSFTDWWRDLGPVGRLDQLPHHTAELAFLSLAIAACIRFIDTKRNRYLLASSISATLAILMVPHAAAPYVAVVGVFILQKVIISIRKKTLGKELLSLGKIALVFALPFAVLIAISMSTNTPVWIANRLWEIAFWQRDPWIWYHLSLSELFLLPLAYIGFIRNIRREPTTTILLGVWVMMPLLFAPFLSIVGAGAGRLIFSTGIYLPLTILASMAVRAGVRSTIGKYFVTLWIIVLVVFASINIYGYTKDRWDYAIREPISNLYYPPKTYFELVTWIKTNIPKESTILTGPDFGSLIAGFAPMFMYLGDNTHGSNWDVDLASHWAFYSGRMSQSEARTWLINHSVSYVVLDPNFYQTTPSNLPYSFLTPLWHNRDVAIYKVE